MENFAKRFTAVYCIAAEIVLLVFLFVIGKLLEVLLPPGTPAYVMLLLKELFGIALACIMVRVSGTTIIFKRRGTGIARGLLSGGYLLVIVVFSSAVSVAQYFENGGDGVLQPWYLILSYFLCMICIGFTEEFVFRGIIAELLIRKLGTLKAGIWKAVILSGILFGAAHASNLLNCTPLGVFIQVAVASVLGMLLTAIYFRSGNIWVTVILHALIDMAAGFAGGLFGNSTIMDDISGYSPAYLISCIPYLIVLFVLLRKKKIVTIQEVRTGR